MTASEETLDDRRYFILGCAFIGALALLASRFYLERTCFLDSAFILVHLLISGGVRINANRYSMALTQLPPLLAAKLGLTVQAIS